VLDLASERQRLLTGVEDEAGDEAITDVVRQVPQAAEVLGADSCPCLDLHFDDPTVRGLEDDVDLEVVLGAVVVELGALVRPGQLPGDLRRHEVLQHRPGGTARFAEPRGVLTEQMAGDPAVDE
jgi:hypothetical protein